MNKQSIKNRASFKHTKHDTSTYSCHGIVRELESGRIKLHLGILAKKLLDLIVEGRYMHIVGRLFIDAQRRPCPHQHVRRDGTSLQLGPGRNKRPAVERLGNLGHSLQSLFHVDLERLGDAGHLVLEGLLGLTGLAECTLGKEEELVDRHAIGMVGILELLLGGEEAGLAVELPGGIGVGGTGTEVVHAKSGAELLQFLDLAGLGDGILDDADEVALVDGGAHVGKVLVVDVVLGFDGGDPGGEVGRVDTAFCDCLGQGGPSGGLGGTVELGLANEATDSTRGRDGGTDSRSSGGNCKTQSGGGGDRGHTTSLEEAWRLLSRGGKLVTFLGHFLELLNSAVAVQKHIERCRSSPSLRGGSHGNITFRPSMSDAKGGRADTTRGTLMNKCRGKLRPSDTESIGSSAASR